MTNYWKQVSATRFELCTPVRPLRFAGMGYANFGPRDWRFVDLESPLPSNPTGYSTTGPIYATKAELLADAERFCSAFYGLALSEGC